MLRISRGEEIVTTIQEFAEEEDIRAASVSGIGAAEAIEIGWYNVGTSALAARESQQSQDYSTARPNGFRQFLRYGLALFPRRITNTAHSVLGQASNLGETQKSQPGQRGYEWKVFSEACEITSMLGNITRFEDKPHVHLHITLGARDFSVVGGHLKRATVSGACEVFIHPLSYPVGRAYDEVTGLNLWSL